MRSQRHNIEPDNDFHIYERAEQIIIGLPRTAFNAARSLGRLLFNIAKLPLVAINYARLARNQERRAINNQNESTFNTLRIMTSSGVSSSNQNHKGDTPNPEALVAALQGRLPFSYVTQTVLQQELASTQDLALRSKKEEKCTQLSEKVAEAERGPIFRTR